MKRLALGLAVAAGVLFMQAPAVAAGATIEARIDDNDVAGSTDDKPIELDPDFQQSISVTITNPTEVPLSVRSIRLLGDVMGLTFFSFDTRVGMQVPPGGSDQRTFELDLFGLDGQAVGLIGSQVVAINDEREPVASVDLVADVRGSLKSVYGIFGIAIFAFTLLTFADALLRLKRRQLPANRWYRGLRFFTPGVGLGLSLIFTLSALRIYHPTPAKWTILLVVISGLFFLLGYLTPNPEEDDEDEELSEVTVPAAAPAMRPIPPLAPSGFAPARNAPVSPAGSAPAAGPGAASDAGRTGTALASPVAGAETIPSSPAPDSPAETEEVSADAAPAEPPEAASGVPREAVPAPAPGEPARGTVAAPKPDTQTGP